MVGRCLRGLFIYVVCHPNNASMEGGSIREYDASHCCRSRDCSSSVPLIRSRSTNHSTYEQHWRRDLRVVLDLYSMHVAAENKLGDALVFFVNSSVTLSVAAHMLS